MTIAQAQAKPKSRFFTVKIARVAYPCEVLERRPGYGRVRITGLTGQYVCTFRHRQRPHCTCPAFQFCQGPEKSCKHVRAIANTNQRASG